MSLVRRAQLGATTVVFVFLFAAIMLSAVPQAHAAYEPSREDTLTYVQSYSHGLEAYPEAVAVSPYGGYFMSLSDYNRPGQGTDANYVLGFNLAQQQTFSYGAENSSLLLFPSAMDFTSDGKVVIADSGYDRVVVVDAITGMFLNELGTEDPENPGLLFPGGLVVAPDNTVWIADTWQNEVEHYAIDGTHLGSFHVDGYVEGAPSPQPESIEMDGAGNLWMAFPNENYVQCYSPEGTLLQTISSWQVLDANGTPIRTDSLAGPRDVAIDPWGTLYIADTSNTRRLVRLLPDGTWLGTYSPSLALESVSDIDIDANGNIWAADPVDDAIKRFNLVKPNAEHFPVTTADLPTGWQTDDVLVTLTVSDLGEDVDATYYSVDGSDPTIEYTGPFTVSADGTSTVKFRSVDVAGSWEAITTGYVRIDHDGPATTIDVPPLTMATSVPVNISASDSVSGLTGLTYSLDGATAVPYTGTITITQYATHTVDAYATDLAGNITHVAKTFKLEPPDTVVPHTNSDISAAWVNHPVTVTLSASDDRSGISQIFYSIGGGFPTTPYTVPFQVSGEGSTDVSYYAVDGSGNSEPPHTKTVNIDTVDPVSSASVPPSSWTAATIDFTGSDDRSGLSSVAYRIDGGAWNYTTNGGSVNVSSVGAHTLEYYAQDMAGNDETVHSVGFEVKSDTTAPTTTSNAVSTYTDSASITLTANDNVGGSGVAWTRWRLDGGAWNTGTSVSTTANGYHLLEWQSQDVLGNLEQVRSASFALLRRYEQGEPGVGLKGVWNTSTSANLSGGNYRYATTPGSAAYITFTGERLDWITARAGSYGKALVTLDGAAPTEVDLYAASVAYKQRVWTSGQLANGVHHVKIEYTGTRNASSSGYSVGVDAFDIVGTGLNVDGVAPTTVATTSGAWTAGSQLVSLSATDADTWVAATYYRISGGSTTTYTAPVALTSESDQIEFWSVDGAGNAETTATVANRVDKTAPVGSDDAPTAWVKAPVSVDLGATDSRSGVSHIDWSLDGSDDASYTAPIIVSSDGTHVLEYVAVDHVGNASTPVQRTIRVDTAAPQVVHDAPAVWGTSPALVTLDATDPLSGVASLSASVDGGASAPYVGALSFVTEGMHSIEYVAIDAAGNTTGAQSHAFGLDFTKPVSTASVNALYAGPATIQINATDNLSGVANTEWRVDGGAWNDGSTAVISQGGSHTLEYRSTDVAGNVETPVSASFSIATRYEQDATGIYYGGTWSYSPSASRSAGGWVYSNTAGSKAALRFTGTELTLIGSKAPSYGIARVTVDGVDYSADFYQATYANKLPILKVSGLSAGDHDVIVAWTGTKNPASTGTGVGIDALDLAGPIVPDATAPTVSGSADEAWRTTPAQVTLSATDAQSGVSAISYRVDGGTTAAYSAPFTVSDQGSHEVEYWAIDLAGNESGHQAITVRTDSTAPVSTATAPSDWVSGSANVTLDVVESGSGLASTVYSLDGSTPSTPYSGTLTISTPGTTTVSFRSVDNLGNTETIKTTTVRVDNDVPAATLTAPSTWTSATVNVGLSATDGLSGVTDLRYGSSSDAITTPWAGSLTLDTEGTFPLYARAQDAVGHMSPVVSATVRIDRTPPVTTSNALTVYSSTATITLSPSDGASGVSATEWRDNGGTWTAGTTAVISTGGAHTLEFRSYDAAGNVEGTKSASFTIGGRVEDSDTRIAYEGTWIKSASAARSGGSWAYSNSAGSRAVFTMTGTGFELVGSTAPTYGRALVTVDGTTTHTVDFYTSGYLHNRKLLTVSGLSNGTHTVSVAWTGTKNAAATGTGIGLDAIDLMGSLQSTTIRYEETDPRLTYYGTWGSSASSKRSAGAWFYSNTAESCMNLAFTGTGFKLFGSTSPSYGIARITIDGGAPQTYDLYTSGYLHNYEVFSAQGLSYGPHTVKIEWTGTKNPASTGTGIGFDAVDITGGINQAAPAGPQLVRMEQTDGRIVYDGTWSSSSSTLRSGGSWVYTNSAGAAAYAAFTGTRLDLIGSTAPTYGRATVTIDGTTQYVADFYSSAFLHNKRVLSITGLTNGPHTVAIEWSGTKNAAATATGIGVDALDTDGSFSQAVMPGYPVVRHEETDSHIAWTGTWASSASASRSGGAWAYTNTSGSAADIEFSGTRVELRVSKAPSYGIATVYLDGVPHQMDLYSAGYLNNQLGWSSGKLTDGVHTLHVEWSGTKNAAATATGIGIDAIDIQGTIQ